MPQTSTANDRGASAVIRSIARVVVLPIKGIKYLYTEMTTDRSRYLTGSTRKKKKAAKPH